MLTLLFALAAVVLYCVAALRQMLALTRHLPVRNTPVRIAGGLAVLCHALVVWHAVDTTVGFNLGFSEIASLVFCAITALLLGVSLFKPVLPAAAGFFPLAALSVIATVGLPDPSIEYGFTPGILIHVATSVLAYALLLIAAGQAILVAIQTHALKHNRIRGVIQVLPPLTAMERLMFDLIRYGTGVLTVSILSGLIFIDNIFAPQMAPKSVLSLCAWVLFTLLLWGRYRRGWRGPMAVRWTLAAVVVLIMAWFGTRLLL
ncbi:cytochrome C assembly family protein [Kushneria aurantia]|uniref:Inner membrane protein YpjD n=1 Tax=Kushneria aurantia TaxID=504092 RepID=A0ABV6G5F9_9GAMM|nr:cytochrome c biogenesis protein CcsA [Kushneria aurantia]